MVVWFVSWSHFPSHPIDSSFFAWVGRASGLMRCTCCLPLVLRAAPKDAWKFGKVDGNIGASWNPVERVQEWVGWCWLMLVGVVNGKMMAWQCNQCSMSAEKHPKWPPGVSVSHRAVLSHVLCCCQKFHLRASDGVLQSIAPSLACWTI